MVKIIRILAPLLLVLVCVTGSFAQEGRRWVGEYFFDEEGGETAGGSKIYVAHTLKIYEKDGKLEAHIYSQGFQTSRDVVASVKIEGSVARFRFLRAGDDHTFPRYVDGALLFSIERTRDGLVTTFGAFSPAIIEDGSFKAFKPVEPSKVSSSAWKTMEFPPNGVLMDLPADVVFDDKIGGKLRYQLLAFAKGMEIRVMSLKNRGGLTEMGFRKLMERDRPGISFHKPFYVIDSETRLGSRNFRKSILIFGPKNYLQILITGREESIPLLARFYRSIELEGRRLAPGDPQPHASNAESIKSLTTSQEILEALDRAPKDIPRKVEFRLRSNLTELNTGNVDRRAILVRAPRVSNRLGSSVTVHASVNPDGSVGDMIVFSSAAPGRLRNFVKATAKIKFIPAKLGGRAVTSWLTINYPRTGGPRTF